MNWWLNGLGFPRPNRHRQSFLGEDGPSSPAGLGTQWLSALLSGDAQLFLFSPSVCLPVWSHFLCLSRLLWVQQDFWTQPGTSLVSYFCWRVLGSATAGLLPTSSAVYLATFPQFITFARHLSFRGAFLHQGVCFSWHGWRSAAIWPPQTPLPHPLVTSMGLLKFIVLLLLFICFCLLALQEMDTSRCFFSILFVSLDVPKRKRWKFWWVQWPC